MQFRSHPWGSVEKESDCDLMNKIRLNYERLKMSSNHIMANISLFAIVLSLLWCPIAFSQHNIDRISEINIWNLPAIEVYLGA